MSKVSKFEAALLTIPMDLISLFVVYGAEQAFMWCGSEPNDRPGFYVEQGRMLQRLKTIAAEKEVPFYNK